MRSPIKLIDVPKEELFDLYITQNKNMDQIAALYSCSAPLVKHYLKKFGISKNGYITTSKEELTELYINQKKTAEEIGNQLGCSTSTINTYLKKHGIKRRRVITATKEELEEWYINQKKSMPEIARMLGFSFTTIQRHIVKLGIPVRSGSEATAVWSKKYLSTHTPKPCSPEHRRKLSEHWLARYKIKPMSEETKEKMRQDRLRRRSDLGGMPLFNPKGCIKIAELGKQLGFNFQHAENGGEFQVIGYSVDGYDKDANVVIEYDEPPHYASGSLIDKDKVRQKKIMEKLGCRFFRFEEGHGILSEYQLVDGELVASEVTITLAPTASPL